jgi:3-hydroxyacyl-CoA dehydrogenase
MNLDDLLENVSVIGAAGKMGSGISTLIAQQVAHLKIKNPDKIYRINLIDVNEKGMDGLQRYIKTQLRKIAEKTIVSLRHAYESREDLIENWEVIDAFIDESVEALRFDTDIGLARNSKLVFEAVIEKEDLKVEILKKLRDVCDEDTFFFTNTSSIPIGYLDKQAGLNGRIIGYHFYNPPIIQKLLEVIPAENTRPELKHLADELGKRLRKKIIPSNDIAGFVGNGHFARDGLLGISEMNKLKDEYGFAGAVYIINRITQDFLVRPMGIFQLIDYVGIDVFQSILTVMSKHLNNPELHSDMINTLMEKNIKGGQRPDGSQKDGFFKYEKNRMTAVYDLNQDAYINTDTLESDLEKKIGELPAEYLPWKKLVSNPGKEDLLAGYFNKLQDVKGMGAELAVNFLEQTKKIGEQLVEDGVAENEQDVNEVLRNGFYWLYGPINDYV